MFACQYTSLLRVAGRRTTNERAVIRSGRGPVAPGGDGSPRGAGSGSGGSPGRGAAPGSERPVWRGHRGDGRPSAAIRCRPARPDSGRPPAARLPRRIPLWGYLPKALRRSRKRVPRSVRPGYCRSYRSTPPVRSRNAPERVGRVYLALSVTDPEESGLSPAGSPAVLADPAAQVVVVTDHLYAVATYLLAGDVRVDAAGVGIEVGVDAEGGDHGAHQRQVVLALLDVEERRRPGDLDGLPVTAGAGLAGHVVRLVSKAFLLGDAGVA